MQHLEVSGAVRHIYIYIYIYIYKYVVRQLRVNIACPTTRCLTRRLQHGSLLCENLKSYTFEIFAVLGFYHRLVVQYQHFVTTCGSHIQGSSWLEKTLEEEMDRLSQNIGI